MDVKLINTLASHRVSVDDKTESIVFEPLLDRNSLGQRDHFGNQFWPRLKNGRNLLLGDNQNMYRSLGILISNRERILRFGDVTIRRNILERTGFRIQLSRLFGRNLSECCACYYDKTCEGNKTNSNTTRGAARLTHHEFVSCRQAMFDCSTRQVGY